MIGGEWSRAIRERVVIVQTALKRIQSFTDTVLFSHCNERRGEFS